MMPTLICQRRNSDKIIIAVEILGDINWESRSRNINMIMKKGDYIIKDGGTPYTITATEFEQDYLVKRIVE